MVKKTTREEVQEIKKQLSRMQRRLETLEGSRKEYVGKIRTYIDGFDKAIGGGISRGQISLLSGPSGTMKTSIALNMLQKNGKNGIGVLYITLEETKESLLETMRSLGLNADDSDFIIDIGRLRMEHEEAEETGNWIDVLKDLTSKRKKSHNLEVLVVDSLTALYSLTNLKNPRKELLHFFSFLRDLGIASIFIFDSNREGKFPHREDSIADASFHVDFRDFSDGSIRLIIRCIKLRHSRHSLDYYELRFENGRFSASPLSSSSL